VFSLDTPRKAAKKLRKHGISFTEAATVFADLLSATMEDPDQSRDEERRIIVGWSDQRHLLMVSHAERGHRIRIISARRLTQKERKAYEQEI